MSPRSRRFGARGASLRAGAVLLGLARQTGYLRHARPERRLMPSDASIRPTANEMGLRNISSRPGARHCLPTHRILARTRLVGRPGPSPLKPHPAKP